MPNARRWFALHSLVLIAVLGMLIPAAARRPAGAARASETADHVVRFQADHDYPPFSLKDPNAEATGYDVELFRDVAARAGLPVQIVLDDWQAVQRRLGSGDVDVVPMLVTPERKQRYLFTQPYLQRYHLVFGHRGGDFIRSIDELIGRRVAVQHAGRAWEALTSSPGIRIVAVDKEGDTLRAVADGRADVAVAPAFIGLHAKRRFGLDGIVPLSPPLLSGDYAFALPKGREDLKRRLDKGLELAFRHGSAERLYMHWLGNVTPQRETYRSGMMVGLWLVIPLLGVATFFLCRWRSVCVMADRAMQLQHTAEREATRLRHHDPVTGAANAGGLRGHLDELIGKAVPFGLIRIDLLDFHLTESITDHVFADRLLQRVGERLRTDSGRPVVASVGRGTFYLVCFDALEPRSAIQAMHELLLLASRQVEIDDVPLEPSCAAGAALFPQHGNDPATLMRAATIACAVATGIPGSGVVYEPGLDPDPRNLTLLSDLRRAIVESSLGFALQAKQELRTGRICGAEMLVRWDHPLYGTLLPADFVPLAERTPVIGEMTLYLIDRAVALCRDWSAEGLAIDLAVNVSANDLIDPRVVAGILERVRGISGCLVLEITETAVMRDADRALAAVGALRAEGVRISLDDFGTGNASLTYLRKLQPDEVKIDRTFIVAVADSAADQAIVRSTIELAHSLGATVTAEGVEDAATLHWLREAGADAAQGFGVARPEAVASFRQRIRRE